MGKTDFFDDDLIQERDSVNEVKIGPGNEPLPNNDSLFEALPVREINLTLLAKRKDEINSQVAGKMEELERLRSRQNSLEREKNALEHLRGNQEKYEIGKRELIDHLDQCLISFEREQMALVRRVEVLRVVETSFKAMDQQLRGMREDEWPEDSEGHRDALTKALAVVESMRKEYHQSVSHVEAMRDGEREKVKATSLLADDYLLPEQKGQRSFGEWLLIGFAFNLTLALSLIALIVFLAFRYSFL